MRISKRAIEDLDRQPKPEKREIHWDDKVPGFGIRRSIAGRITYVVKLNIRGGQQNKWVTLGDWPSLIPDVARELAMEHRAAGRQGRDFEAENEARAAKARQEAAGGMPLTELLDAWRARTEAEMTDRTAKGQAGAHERELLRLEKKVLRPDMEGKSVQAYDGARFQALINQQASPNLARNLRTLFVRFIEFAQTELVLKGIRVDWPAKLMVRGAPKSRSYYHSLEQTAAAWIAAGQLGRRGALLRFIILTLPRRGEAAALRDQDLLLDHAQLGPHWRQVTITNKSRREHLVPLSGPALALLRWLPRRSTRTTPETDYIFSGRAGRKVSGWTDLISSMRELACLPEGGLHDFRRTGVSVLADHGVDAVVVDKLLNHKASATLPGVMAVYQRSEMWGQRRAALDLWAELLFAEIEKQLGRPVSRETWGFDEPFSEVRIVRKAGQSKGAPHRRRSQKPSP